VANELEAAKCKAVAWKKAAVVVAKKESTAEKKRAESEAIAAEFETNAAKRAEEARETAIKGAVEFAEQGRVAYELEAAKC